MAINKIILKIQEEASQEVADLLAAAKNKAAVSVDKINKAAMTKVEEIKAIGLDVPQVTELAQMLINEGINLPPDILTVDEMVVELCQLK